MVRETQILVVALFSFLLACGPSDPEPIKDGSIDMGVDIGMVEDTGTVKDTGMVEDTGTRPFTCHVSVCMAGAVTRDDGGNPRFAKLCEQFPGIIMDSGYPMFGMDQKDDAVDALINALDTDHDGDVDENDDNCEVTIVGYSWGGTHAPNVAKGFLESELVSASRKVVHQLVTIDPYAVSTKPPFKAIEKIVIPPEVKLFWEYRHSTTPNGDCSSGSLGGPYKGVPSECSGETRCKEYDYSLAPEEEFTGVEYIWKGNQIGHCGIVDACTPAVLHNVLTGEDYSHLPPEV